MSSLIAIAKKTDHVTGFYLVVGVKKTTTAFLDRSVQFLFQKI